MTKSKKTTKPETTSAEPEVIQLEREPAAEKLKRGQDQKDRQLLDPAARYLEEHGSVQIKDLMVEVYGGEHTPDRELSALKKFKEDDRFIICDLDHGGRKTNYVRLAADEPLTEAADLSYDEPPALPESKEETKTIGEMVEAGKNAPARIPWKVDVRDRVIYQPPGGEPVHAQIYNIRTADGMTTYDLKTATGTIDDVPAAMILPDLEAQSQVERAEERTKLLLRHAERGAELAKQHYDMAAVEIKLSDALKKHHKAQDEIAEEMAKHLASDPFQLEIGDAMGDGGRGKKMAAPPSASEDKLADHKPIDPDLIARRIAAGDVVDDDTIEIEQLMAACMDRLTDSAKPQQVVPVKYGEADADLYVVGSIADGVAVLLPVVDGKFWNENYADPFGPPKKEPGDVVERLEANGRWTGTPVKHGRKKLFVGPEEDALLLRVPTATEPELVASGKDAAAGN